MAENNGIHSGHRERLRERFRSEGLSGFSEHEVLELLLTYAIPRADVNPLAHALIARFGSLSGVLEASENELMRVNGIGRTAATLLTMMPPLLGYYRRSALGEKPVISNLRQAREYCRALFVGEHDELFYLVCLDKGARVTRPVLMQRGTIDHVGVPVRSVVEEALRHHAFNVILVHNHPGGGQCSSDADYAVTEYIVRALHTVGIGVVDHLIFCGDECYSMMKNCPCAGHEELSYISSASVREAKDIELETMSFDGEAAR